MASPAVVENLPPSLNSSAEQPPLFDGTTKLYTCYTCPFAQRVWIARNYKGLQDKIKLVPLILEDRPAWYKEKVYSVNKVPALEHNGKIIGESLDLIKYVDSNFEGPSLFPDDPEKKKFVEELWSYVDEFIEIVYTSFKGEGPKECGPAFDHLESALGKFEDGPFFLGQFMKFVEKMLSCAVEPLKMVFPSIEGGGPKEWGPAFDHLESALCKFEDGPFFLGQFSGVDIAYITFVERFQIFLSEAFKYEITADRPKLAAWIEEMNKIDAYKQTKTDPKELVEFYKKRFTAQQ